MAIKKGDKVKVHYTGTFDEGDVFDSSEGSEPLEFTAGAGQVIKGFDDAVIGMNKNQEKSVKIPANEAYGEYREELVKKVPAQNVPSNAKKGMVLGLSAPDGRQFPAKIKDIDDKFITLDLNHPLAGKNLNFKIKIVDISA